jgi:hypothetical protein
MAAKYDKSQVGVYERAEEKTDSGLRLHPQVRLGHPKVAVVDDEREQGGDQRSVYKEERVEDGAHDVGVG